MSDEEMRENITELCDRIEREHTRYGDPCEKCGHRFLYDSCTTCGDEWPCASAVFAADVRERFLQVVDEGATP